MDSLPSDLLRYVAACLTPSELVRLMLVARRYHVIVREILYSHLQVNLLFQQSQTVKLLRTLNQDNTSPMSATHPSAHLIRHLTVTGAALAAEAQQLSLSKALTQMTGLLSLDIAAKAFPSSVVKEIFPDELCRSESFLPNLVALKTDDAEIAMAIVPMRPVSSLFVDDTVCCADSISFLHLLGNSRCDVAQLQIRLEAADEDGAVEMFHLITQHFKKLSALSIEIFIVNPCEKPLSWLSVKDALRRMGPSMCTLHALHSFSICLYPEPVAQEQEVEEAMQLCLQYCTALRRLELKWHTWAPSTGFQRVLRYDQLLRRQWLFKKLMF